MAGTCTNHEEQKECRSPTDGGDCDGFVRFVDIRPNDVLFGRGPTANGNPGNIAFRSLVATRKPEYLRAGTHKEKNGIAREIISHIRCYADPPGRFLTAVDKSVAKAIGFSGDEEMVLRQADDKTVLEKTKQTLRQQKRDVGAKQRERPSRKRPERLACVESQGTGEHGMTHAVADTISSATATVDNISSTDVGGITTGDYLDDFSFGEDDTCMPFGANDLVSTENRAMAIPPALGAEPNTEETISPSQSSLIQPIAMMPPDGPMKLARGMGTSGALEETGLTREKGNEDALDRRSSVLESLRIASELVKKITCTEVHGAGTVAYISNIGAEERMRKDLVSLGIDLYRHFAGVDPFDKSMDCDSKSGVEETKVALQETSIAVVAQAKKKERRSTSRKYVLLRDMGLPVSLCILVSSLLDAEDENAAGRYKTADEVEKDLSLMFANPDRYLFDADAERRRGQLVFREDRIYGRDHNLSCMMEVFDRVTGSTNGPREMLLISGYSGTGKSALAEQLRGPLLQKNGHFVSGKFDQLGQAQPMSVIFDAFNEYCVDITKGSEDTLAEICGAIKEALGSNVNVLRDLIPNLSKVIGEPATETVQVGEREALNRFLFCFRLFVQAISSPSHPVVLFLDDLQWADDASLDLISTIVSDAEIASLLFVGCYRDNEVGKEHPLHKEVGKLAITGVSITGIKLKNIDRRSVNALVSDTLYLSPRLTWPLADVTYTKTSGNPLVIVQFLRSLYDENLLQYSARSRRWEWEVEAIQAKDIADSVVDLMTHKMQKLDPDVQWLLKVAACLGSQSEASTLKLLSSNDGDDGSGIIQFFDLAVNEGLMSRMSSRYKFSHDQIQQAAYLLIPEGERGALHLHIGRLLWKKATENELNKIIFVVVDQLHRGSSLISDHAEKVEIARLCLRAGEMAMASSAFLQASICLLQGSTLLEERDWLDHYDLTLRLFSCCAQAQYITGNCDGAAITVKPIFSYGRCLQDKLQAHYALLYSLGAQGLQLDAISHGLDVLAELGETFPNEPSRVDVAREFAKTRAMLEVPTVAISILQMNEMEDAQMVAIMKILSILSRYAHQVNQPLMSLMVFQMLQLSLCHGVSRDAPIAFAGFAHILCTNGEFEQGSLCGKISLSLLDRYKTKDHLALVYTVVYGMIKQFSAPMQSNLPLLRHAHEFGMSMGDVEGALTASANYVTHAVQNGSKLGPLAEEVKTHMQAMEKHNHHMLWYILPYYQAILNLMGDCEVPTDLTGKAMNQDELLSIACEKQLLNVIEKIFLLRLWLAYLFGRYDVAADMIERSKLSPNRLESVVFGTFFTGLTAVVMARKGEDVRKWRNIALEALGKMKTWAVNSPWNFQHKLDLLNAETAYYLYGDEGGAAKAYDRAVSNAGEHGFVHEQALACERAGIFYSETSSAEIAAGYFERAKKYYLEWGATRKVKSVCEPLTG